MIFTLLSIHSLGTYILPELPPAFTTFYGVFMVDVFVGFCILFFVIYVPSQGFEEGVYEL